MDFNAGLSPSGESAEVVLGKAKDVWAQSQEFAKQAKTYFDQVRRNIHIRRNNLRSRRKLILIR
jgi:hypothetical protein